MSDTFDESTAKERHEDILREVKRIRDGITNDVIDYYFEYPTSEENEREKRDGMHKFLKVARDRINDLLRNKFVE